MRWFRLAVTLAGGLLAAGVAPAQDYSWYQPATGTAAGWTAAANWVNPPGPPTGNGSTTATMLLTTLAGNPNNFTLTNDVGPFTLNRLAFGSVSTATFTQDLGANSLTLGGTTPQLQVTGSGFNTLSGAGGLVLAAPTTFGGAGNGILTVATPVSGSAGLTLAGQGNGILNLNSATSSTFTGGVFLTSSYLQLQAVQANTLGANTVTVSGGGLRFGAANSYANNFVLNNTLTIAGGSGQQAALSTGILSGVLSGAGGVAVRNYSTTGSTAGLTLTGANTYSGPTLVDQYLPNPQAAGAATLTVSGANGVVTGTSGITVGQNATFSLVNATGTVNANRVGDATPVVLNGGRFNFTPGVAGTNETVGGLTVSGLGRLNTAATGVSDLTFSGGLTRGGRDTLLLESASFGTVNSATVATRVFFTGATAASLGALAAGSGTGQETAVLPWAIAGGPTNPRSFVGYDVTAGGGLQVIPADNATYVLAQTPGSVSAAAVLNKNVRFNGSGTYTLTGLNTINALTTNTSTSTVVGGTLTVHSGAIVNFDNLVFNGTALDFQTRTAYLHNAFAFSVRGASTISGSGGVVVSGGGASTTRALLLDTAGANPFTGGLTVNGTTSVGFFRDDQLGSAGEPITLNGGTLSYNGAGGVALARPITLGSANGAFANNQTNNNTGNTTAAATSATVTTLSGVVSGPGALVKEGVGALNLSNAGNTYAGGTVVSAGSLQFTADGNLGAAGTKVMLNGGTLQPLAAVSLSRPVEVNASSTVLAAADVTLSGGLTTVAGLYGSSAVVPTVSKSGAGQLSLTGNLSGFSGNLVVAAGGLRLAGAAAATQVTDLTVSGTATLTIDNQGTYLADRVGDAARITLSGTAPVVSYLSPNAAVAGVAERVGTLNAASAGGVFSVANTSGGPLTLAFRNLSVGAPLTIRGDALGDAGGNFTRVLFDQINGAAPTPGRLTNVFFAGAAGSGSGTQRAAYDLTRGVVLFVPPSITGTAINNFAPDNVPTTAEFTTTGDATAATGAQIDSLILSGGSLLTLNGGNAASATNGNTPDGTLSLAGGALTSQNGAKSIVAGTAPTPTVAFGAAAATVTTTSDLTVGAGVTLSGSGGLTKLGTGTLAVNGTYAVTGGTTVGAGTLSTTGNVSVGALAVAPGTTFTTNGGNLAVTDLGGAGTVAVGTGSLTATIAGTSSFAGTVTGTGAFTKAGAGTLTVSGSVGYGSGAITGGTLALGASNVLPAGLPLTLGPAAGGSGFNLNLNGFNQTLAGLTLVSPTATTTALTVPAGSTLTLAGDVAFVNNTATPNNSLPVVFAGAGAIDLGGATRNLVVQSNNNTGTGDVQIGVPLTNGGLNYTGNPTPGGVVAYVALTAPGSTYAGPTTINRGLFRATVANGFSPNSVVTLAAATGNTATLDLVGLNQTVGGLASSSAGTNQVTLGGGTLTVAQSVGTSTNAVISGTGGLTKTGPGVLTLTGVNAYTGPTTVSGGTLRVGDAGAGSTAAGSAVTATAGGTVGGSGTINGPLTVAAGGGLAPGNSIGSLSVNNGVTLAAGAAGSPTVWTVELNAIAPNATAGAVDGDRLTLTGTAARTLTFSTAAGAAIRLDLTLLAGTFTEGSPVTYPIAVNASTGASAANVAGLGGVTFEYNTIGFAATAFSTSVSTTGDILVSFVPVPEPATVLAVAAIGLGGLRAVRRRRAVAG